jgi:hypothetical protein
MAAIDEEIVREYFEQNGFFVRQGRKYQVQARRKTGGEEIDLLVFNPAWRRGTRKPDFFLFSNELPFLNRAIVSVRGWHTDVFTPAMMKHSPEIFRFVEESVAREASRLFPEDPGDDTAGLTRILVLPALPTAEPFRSQSVELLKARGVDAIISFRAMLLDLLDKVEVNQSYSKSSVLQVMRILKNYDLLRDMQLEMFSDRPAPTTRKPRA